MSANYLTGCSGICPKVYGKTIDFLAEFLECSARVVKSRLDIQQKLHHATGVNFPGIFSLQTHQVAEGKAAREIQSEQLVLPSCKFFYPVAPKNKITQRDTLGRGGSFSFGWTLALIFNSPPPPVLAVSNPEKPILLSTCSVDIWKLIQISWINYRSFFPSSLGSGIYFFSDLTAALWNHQTM